MRLTNFPEPNAVLSLQWKQGSITSTVDTLFSYLKRFFTKGKEDCVKVFDVFSEFGQAHVLEGLPHSDAVSEAVGVIQVL
jgi:hypothetical protein